MTLTTGQRREGGKLEPTGGQFARNLFFCAQIGAFPINYSAWIFPLFLPVLIYSTQRMSGSWQLFLGSPRLGLSGDALKWSNHSNLPFAPLTSPLLQRHDILAQPVWSGISASAIPITHSFFFNCPSLNCYLFSYFLSSLSLSRFFMLLSSIQICSVSPELHFETQRAFKSRDKEEENSSN